MYLICSLQPAFCTQSTVYRASQQSAVRSLQFAVYKKASLSLLLLASALEEPPSMPDDPEIKLHGGHPEEIVRAAYLLSAVIVAEVIKRRCP